MKMKTICALTLAAVALLAPPADAHHTRERGLIRFDGDFARAAKRYFPPPMKRKWKWLRAQCWVESGLNPAAMSRAQAKGLCQIEDGTAAALLSPGESIWSPRANIKAAARYMRRMYEVWNGRARPLACHWRLALASYNAGPGSIIRAQALAGDALCWASIQPHLGAITGLRNSAQTTKYIERIAAACGRAQCSSLR